MTLTILQLFFDLTV